MHLHYCLQVLSSHVVKSKWIYSSTLLIINSFSKGQILGSSKLKYCADNNFRFHEKGGRLSKMVKNIVEKGEIVHYK